MALRNPFEPLPRVDPETFLGITWGGVGLAGVFLAARAYARLGSFQKLFLDDYLVLTAWLMFIASSIIWQLHIRWIYNTELVGAGLVVPDFDTLPHEIEASNKASLASIMLFYTSLYSIKLSFLVFFRKLGDKVRHQKVLWWVVTLITVLAWVVGFATIDYHCLVSSFSTIISTCETSQHIDFDQATLKANMAIDVMTDAMIMSIPITLLWKVKISFRQKLALIGIFSLTILTMIFAIVRVAVITSYSAQPDPLWLYMWCLIEVTIALLVACLVTFRLFFTKNETRSGAIGLKQDGTTIRSLLRSTKSWFRSSTGNSQDSVGNTPSLSTEDNKIPFGSRDSNEDGHHMIDLAGIHVSKTFQTTSNFQSEDHPSVKNREIF